MCSYYKNIKTELSDCPHTFSPNLTADLHATQYANEQTFFSSSTGSSSIWWPFCAKVVSNWFQASSFGLLLLLLFLLLERSLGNNGDDAKGVRGGGGVRPSCPYLCPPCKLAGTEPEYSHKQHWDRLDSTTPNWTTLDWTKPDWTGLDSSTFTIVSLFSS